MSDGRYGCSNGLNPGGGSEINMFRTNLKAIAIAWGVPFAWLEQNLETIDLNEYEVLPDIVSNKFPRAAGWLS